MDRNYEEEIDIVALISQSVQLKRAGSLLQGLCPFHADKNTFSLTVYPATNSWACFGVGCGDKLSGKRNGGGVVEWVKQKERLSYREALHWLDTRYRCYREPLRKFTAPRKAPVRGVVDDRLVRYWHSLLDTQQRRFYFQDRGFSDETIDRELWGWNGHRYTIPVWEGKPAGSSCIGVRRRASELCGKVEPKYLGISGANKPTVWGRWHCRNADLVFAFAGELDAARAVQDGLAAFSLVNGVSAFLQFPEDWPNLWFPNTGTLVGVFDKVEEVMAGRLASVWNKAKGSMTARVFHWPPSDFGKDYCDWRDSGRTSEKFVEILLAQTRAIFDRD